MTTALQRLLNVVFVVITVIPPLAATAFFLNGGGHRIYAPLIGVLACAPVLLLAVTNFIIYRKFTAWHSSDENTTTLRRQVLLALIPACTALAYGLSVMIFYWRDTKPLYLQCEVKKAKSQEDIGSHFVFGIRHTPPFYYYPMDNYWTFEGYGWMSDTAIHLGFFSWDFESESWKDLLGYFWYHPNQKGEWFRPNGGLLIYDDKFVSRGWRENSQKAAEHAAHDAAMQSLVPGYVGDHYEGFDKLIVNRETGAFVLEGGYEGVCSQAPEPRAATKASGGSNNKF